MDQNLNPAIQPVVSVILPVFNGLPYVGEAIESILAQSFIDYELVVIDDGSTDDTPAALAKYKDTRIRLVRQANHGLARTLNRGIVLAKGRYIARQDQDDVSLPERLGKQVAYLDKHPECGMVGTWAEIWRERTKTEREHRHPTDNSSLKFELLFNNPFVHSSVMIRKTALDRVGPYCTDPSRQPPEDYELWSRIGREFELANIAEVLHRYREVESSMSREGPSPFRDHLITICAENIALASGEHAANPQVVNIAALTHGDEKRIRETPDFSAMRMIQRRAAGSVVAPEKRAFFDEESDRRIKALRFRYLELRGTSNWLRCLVGIVGRTARFMRRAL